MTLEKTGVPGIYRTPVGTYKVAYRDPSRRQHWKSFQRMQDARSFKRSIERGVERGEYTDPRNARITVEELWPTFMTSKETAGKLRATTRDLYERSFRCYIAGEKLTEEFGSLGRPIARRGLVSITAETVEAWIAAMGVQGVGSGAIRAAVKLLLAILNHAERRELIPRNRARSVSIGGGNSRKSFLSAEQVERLASAVPDPDRALIYTLAYTGMRIGEAAALRVSDADLLRGRLSIERTASEVAGKLHIGPTKTVGSTRTIALPSFLAVELRGHIDAAHTGSYEGEALLFSAPDGGALRPGNWRRRVFKLALAKAGLSRRLRVHDLRHTCASLLVAQGAHAEVIADHLGHSSPVVTQRVYAHILPSLAERVASGLEETYQRAREAAAGQKPVIRLAIAAGETD